MKRKVKFKFNWDYLGKYKPIKKLTFEEMLQNYLLQAKENQKVLRYRLMSDRDKNLLLALKRNKKGGS